MGIMQRETEEEKKNPKENNTNKMNGSNNNELWPNKCTLNAIFIILNKFIRECVYTSILWPNDSIRYNHKTSNHR